MKFNTVTGKIIAQILCISIAALLLLNWLFPSIFYAILKSHLQGQVSHAMSMSALRQSYIWNNNRYLRDIAQNSDLNRLIREYYTQTQPSAQSREAILSYFPVLENGRLHENAGYISFTNYILLFTSKGDIFYPEDAKEAADILTASDWYRTLDKKEELKYHIPTMGTKQDGRYFCVIESFWAGDVNCFAVNMIRLEDVLAQIVDLDNLGIQDYLLCNKDEILYCHQDTSQIRFEECPSYLFEGKQYEPLLWENNSQSVFSVLCTYIDEELFLIAYAPKSLLLEPYQTTFFYFQMLLCGLAFLLLICFTLCLKGTLRRLTQLEKKMNRVRGGDYDVTTYDNRTDEIASLANTFQMMLQKIKEDMKKNEEMQYLLMVSAIDPHYIYNTLNTITALAELGRNEEVAAVNTAFIGTLKDRVKMKNYKTFDTVKAEQETLKQYMLIQSYLCSMKIDYSFNVAPEHQDLIIPKNIIQPLVENSIKHGILCSEEDVSETYQGKIDVSVTAKDSFIHIEVCDNGKGMDPQALAQFGNPECPQPSEQMEHIGIYNVRMRLNYLYQGNYQFTIKSSPGNGCRIHLCLPDRADTPTPRP